MSIDEFIPERKSLHFALSYNESSDCWQQFWLGFKTGVGRMIMHNDSILLQLVQEDENVPQNVPGKILA
jgi:hypothetical protein